MNLPLMIAATLSSHDKYHPDKIPRIDWWFGPLWVVAGLGIALVALLFIVIKDWLSENG